MSIYQSTFATPRRTSIAFSVTVWFTLLLTAQSADAGAPSPDGVFIYSASESSTDHRYDYHWAVFKAALEATRSKFGSYTLTKVEPMTEARAISEIMSPSGQINTMVLDSTSQLERDLLPVKIPVDKGLIGYRVFLIRDQDQSRFSRVKTLDDLRKFSIGQGKDWSDVAIYERGGFHVVKSTSYEGLFDMLAAGRFDAFGRGVTEVLPELEEHKGRLPSLSIEKSVLLYYPMPFYFWFPKNDWGTRNARRVQEGMQIIVANGTLDKMFTSQFDPVIKALQLKGRTLLRIPNPDLPPEQPFGNERYWFNPLR